MKRFYLLALLSASAISATAQVELGFSYSATLPLQDMRENIKPVHSLNGIFLSKIKGAEKFSWGIETGFGQYAFFTKDQEIRFPDGSGITTEVSYSSNVFTGGVLARYNIFKEATVNPYIHAKLGVANFFSKVFVHDPEDEDDCKPLDKKTPISDVSYYGAYGAGIMIDITGKKCKPRSSWIDFSVSSIHGTKLDYINVKDIKDHVHIDPNNPAPVSDKSEPLNIRFINVATQTIHEHQLAEVYSSALRMLEFKLGIIFRLHKE
jgi:hypothetical protein